MKRRFSWFLAALCITAAVRAQTPQRVNKAIELLEQGQPVYYTGSHGGFEEGVRMAQTWADYITYDMEHAPLDMQRLADFMRGLVKGGPTRSGHRTPAVIVTLPTDGTDEETMRANAWMVKQVLATGVHGILLCHADTPGAVKTFVESARYPYMRIGVNEGLDEGKRGAHGAASAAQIWGISTSEYLRRADVWPLNPKGEILLGLKIEDKRALANVDQSLKVPGIAFAEWGPGDMGMSLGFPENHDPPYPKPMLEARAKVLAACKANKIFFLNSVHPNDVVAMIQEGVMIGAGSREAAEIGRRYTKRTMPQ
jgi:4-hydroxy-2-oxoheptanedioate aldolase